jgi:hypothetical protein
MREAGRADHPNGIKPPIPPDVPEATLASEEREEQMAELNGGCLCGAVRYTSISTPEWVGVCHCRDCQIHTGSALRSWCACPRRLSKSREPSKHSANSAVAVIQSCAISAQNAAHRLPPSQPCGTGWLISMLAPSMIQAWSFPRWRFIATALCPGSN